ncbi:MAG TPA: NAD(P)(+) transhydrogenase (Re/Si-specific) subunit beta [Chloroflexia bacterium]|jgi:NAD(P) transhydrogenase subunit beta
MFNPVSWLLFQESEAAQRSWLGLTPSTDVYLTLAYIVAAACFIIGIRRLSSPKTARNGNRVAAVGMAVAVVATFFSSSIQNILFILVGIAIGSAIGFFLARSVQMTEMPQMVALFNAMGGGAAALTSTVEFLEIINRGSTPDLDVAISTVLGVLIGAMSFSGSIIAIAKLYGWISSAPITYGGQQIVNAVLALGAVGLGVWLIIAPNQLALIGLIVLAAVLGVLLVLPIGGADMPVVISLLNSFTGMAAAFTGFVLSNPVLIIAGALVGASGMLLTVLMGRAMNRSVANVIFGAFGSAGVDVGSGASAAGKSVRELGVDDAATLMAYANQVIVVPGYGMAVARAQNAVRELADILQSKGVTVKYAIHPVAGRMPGHMNVLLAEADVPYNQLFEMEDINPEFSRTDVALIIGANDVVNPAARNDPKSPIYGMPILDVDKAQNVIVMKRSMRSGFAGIENELFYEDRTSMLFGDAKDMAEALVASVKQL